MKTSTNLWLLFILTGAITFSACKKSSPPPPSTPPSEFVNYTANIQGTQETPPNSSIAGGNFNGIYNMTNQTLIYSVSYSSPPPISFNPTAWHIHRGDSGVAGPVIFDLGPIVPSPLNDTLLLSASQYNELSNGKYYIHIHSTAFPNGEIRGQIVKQ